MAKPYQLKQRAGSGLRTGIDFAAELNPQQLAAVTAEPGASLVIAGAGSGKTRTLTYRVAYLLEQGFKPYEILLLTFTNKAAREMLERVIDLIAADLRGMWSGTFHSIGNRMLQRHAEAVGYRPGFTILDRDDQQALLKLILAERAEETKRKGFPKPTVIAGMMSLAVNTATPLEEIIDERYPYFLVYEETLLAIAADYAQRKQAANTMDFDDLLVRSTNLLRDGGEPADNYAKKFRAILVDEYQDTNIIQAEFVDLLAAQHGHLMVVGDDAQSIYSWRGADFRNILEFTKRYPEAKTYPIESNYRSFPPILELANAAIAENRARLDKKLTPVRSGEAVTPAVVELATSAEQAQFVTQRIGELLEEGFEPEDIAVLYRAHFHSMELQLELTRSDIPFRITSGLRFFEQAHVKDLAAFVKFAANTADEISFKRCVKLLPGVGDKSAEKLWQATCATLQGDNARMPELLDTVKPPAKAQADWEQYVHTWAEIVPDGEPLLPAEMFEAVLEAHYGDYARANFTNAEQRLEDLHTLIAFARQFDEIAELLAQLALLTNVDGENDQLQEEPGGAVSLSTIHQAKGLEWKVVFLISLAESLFPTSRSQDDPEAIEEERRLFYVGVTRAMDQLILTWPEIVTAGSQPETFLQASRFLRDLPEHTYEDWRVEREW